MPIGAKLAVLEINAGGILGRKDLDRESCLVKVVDGKQVVVETLPPASGR